MPTSLLISLNGQPLHTHCATLHHLLETQNFNFQTAFACAVNQRFVPRTHWAAHHLQTADAVEVITPVTGG
jgi:sulfur carrier protein